MQKIIKLESFQDQNASFPSQIYSFQKLRDVANVDDDLFIGHTTIKSNKLDFIFSRDRKKSKFIDNKSGRSIKNKRVTNFSEMEMD